MDRIPQSRWPYLGQLSWARWLLLPVVLLLAGTCVARAEGITAAGDGDELWIISPAKDGTGFDYLHWRASDQPEYRLARPHYTLKGTLMPGGITAGNGFLWLAFTDGAVQTIRAVDDPGGTRLFDHLLMPSLPKVAAVRSMAVAKASPWALVRVEDAGVLEQIDGQSPVAKPAPQAPPAPATPAEKAEPEAPPPDPAKPLPRPAPPAKRSAGSVAVDRLLKLGRTRWEPVALPADWPADAAAWLVALAPDDERPCLVAVAAGERVLRWYEWKPTPAAAPAPAKPATTPAEKEHQSTNGAGQPEPAAKTPPPPEPKSGDAPPQPASAPPPAAPTGQWVRRDVTLEDTLALPPKTLDRQLLVARRLSTPKKIELEILYPREGGLKPIGTLTLDEPCESWTLARAGDKLALIARSETGEFSWRRLSLSGAADPQPLPLTVRIPSLTHMVDFIVFIAGLALATPFLILMWKRDPQGQSVQLPRGLVLAELGSRAAAAFVDMAPGLAFVLLFRGVPLDQLTALWPRTGITWDSVSPQLTAIGIYIGYTFLAELFFGTTPGKAMLGLRVTGLHGEPPNLWQVLARNLLKAVELAATPLLVFALISPTRQRVGDMLARTVIVRRATPQDDEPRQGLFDRNDDDDRDDDRPPDPRPRRRDRK